MGIVSLAMSLGAAGCDQAVDEDFVNRVLLNDGTGQFSAVANAGVETLDPSWGACPLLFNDACPIYTLRPFGCRCMVSDMGMTW